MDEGNVSRFLDLTYGAVVDAALWPRVVEDFAALVCAQGAGLVWQNQADRSGQGVVRRLDPAVLSTYFEAFSRAHPSQRWMKSPRERVRHFVPHIVADDDAMPKEELMRTAFYNDFMRPYDMHSVVRLGLAAEGLDAAFLIVTRPKTRDRFSAEDMGLATSLHQHLIRAFALSRKMAGQPLGAGTSEVIEKAPVALFVVDRDARVLEANQAGVTLLNAGAGLSAPAGRLASATPDGTSLLRRLVWEAAEDRVGGGARLERPDHALPLAATVTPLRADQPPHLRTGPWALVCVNDPDAPASADENRLRQLLGLTRAEAKVAALLYAGATPKEAAEDLGVSFFTVRGHLVRIFEKTGTGRQSELVRLIGSTDAMWPADA